MTKKEQRMLWMYENEGHDSLLGAYKTPSKAKWDVYNDLLFYSSKYDGYGIKVIGHNTFTFSFAFKYRDYEGREFLCYITKLNEYHILLS